MKHGNSGFHFWSPVEPILICFRCPFSKQIRYCYNNVKIHFWNKSCLTGLCADICNDFLLVSWVQEDSDSVA